MYSTRSTEMAPILLMCMNSVSIGDGQPAGIITNQPMKKWRCSDKCGMTSTPTTMEKPPLMSGRPTWMNNMGIDTGNRSIYKYTVRYLRRYSEFKELIFEIKYFLLKSNDKMFFHFIHFMYINILLGSTFSLYMHLNITLVCIYI